MTPLERARQARAAYKVAKDQARTWERNSITKGGLPPEDRKAWAAAIYGRSMAAQELTAAIDALLDAPTLWEALLDAEREGRRIEPDELLPDALGYGENANEDPANFGGVEAAADTLCKMLLYEAERIIAAERAEVERESEDDERDWRKSR